MNLAFAGTPEPAAAVLAALLQSPQHRIRCVYTQPDRPAGRGRKSVPGPVKRVALERAVPVLQPATGAELSQDRNLDAVDALVVVAYGLILPPAVLARPRRGCINVHASLLPRWRGAAPIQRAIQAGDRRTGVSIMLMDAGIDTGKIVAQQSCAIRRHDTSASLAPRLAKLGGACLLEALADIESGAAEPARQDDGAATYAAKISKQEAAMDWSKTATQLERDVRAFNPAPVAFTHLGGVRIRVWGAAALADGDGRHRPGDVISYGPQGLDVAAGKGALRILFLQGEGGRRQSIGEFYNGRPDWFAPGR